MARRHRMIRTLTCEADRLLSALHADRRRDVFLAAGEPREWFVSYGGGQFSDAAVNELIVAGKIISEFSECPDLAYVAAASSAAAGKGEK